MFSKPVTALVERMYKEPENNIIPIMKQLVAYEMILEGLC